MLDFNFDIFSYRGKPQGHDITFSEKVDDSRCPHKIKLSFSSLVNSLDKNSTSFPSSG
jgi:hypothetical protein